jgi:hypothetical protein
LPHSNNDYTPPRRGRVNLVFVHGVSGQLLSPVVLRLKLSIALKAIVWTSIIRDLPEKDLNYLRCVHSLECLQLFEIGRYSDKGGLRCAALKTSHSLIIAITIIKCEIHNFTPTIAKPILTNQVS